MKNQFTLIDLGCKIPAGDQLCGRVIKTDTFIRCVNSLIAITENWVVLLNLKSRRPYRQKYFSHYTICLGGHYFAIVGGCCGDAGEKVTLDLI